MEVMRYYRTLPPVLPELTVWKKMCLQTLVVLRTKNNCVVFEQAAFACVCLPFCHQASQISLQSREQQPVIFWGASVFKTSAACILGINNPNRIMAECAATRQHCSAKQSAAGCCGKAFAPMANAGRQPSFPTVGRCLWRDDRT